MAMGALLGKELRRTIRHTFGQFAAIASIVALGCGFFAGIQATTPDMNEMANQHYRDTNLMDLQILSTIGLDEQEVEAVARKHMRVIIWNVIYRRHQTAMLWRFTLCPCSRQNRESV